MNVGTFTGRVGNDAELRFTQNQTAVAGFSVAVDVGFGNNKTTMWLKCTVWGKRAESLSQYILKGDMISVSGEVSLEQWENNGKSGANVKLNVREVTLGGSAQGQQNTDQSNANKGYQPPPGAAPAPAPAGDFEDFSDDIPF
jgi:single-strand DNA-binding protein